jgi:hypothetical protein
MTQRDRAADYGQFSAAAEDSIGDVADGQNTRKATEEPDGRKSGMS